MKNWEGKVKWYESTIRSMLQNEKYKGDALLQKTYTIDFLSKKREINNGEVPQYYVEESHPAIIDPEMWEAVQLEMERRKAYCETYHIKNLDTRLVFNGKIICSECGNVYSRKTWMQHTGEKRRVWMCSSRYKTKGIKGCDTGHLDETVLKKAFVEIFNALLGNKQYFLDKWETDIVSVDALKKYRLLSLKEVLRDMQKVEEFDEMLCIKILDHIKVVEKERKLIVVLLDETNLECEI